MTPAHRSLLRRCRDLVEEEIQLLLEAHCVIGPRNGEPIRATLEKGTPARHVRRLERLKADIDRAMEKTR